MKYYIVSAEILNMMGEKKVIKKEFTTEISREVWVEREENSGNLLRVLAYFEKQGR